MEEQAQPYVPSTEPRHDSVFCIDDMEGTHVYHEIRLNFSVEINNIYAPIIYLFFDDVPESPVVVVLSGSMEPAFQRGDILFLNNQDDPIRVGEIVVFKIKDRDIPIGVNFIIILMPMSSFLFTLSSRIHLLFFISAQSDQGTRTSHWRRWSADEGR